MGLAVFDDEKPFAESGNSAAAVLCRTEHGNLHAGILYRKGTQVQVLHLGWFDYLDDQWKWQKLWATPEAEPEKLSVVRGHCRRIWKRYRDTRKFPYALAWCKSDFDQRGQLRLGDGSQGLTCATFILAVFRAAGIELVDESTWPIRQVEDMKFIASIQGWAQPQHVALLQAEVLRGVKRIHPHEVLGACAISPIPAGFEPTSEAAACVLHELDGPPDLGSEE